MNDNSIDKYLFWSLNILIPLTSGALIYLYFRPETYLSTFLSKLFGVHFEKTNISGSVIRYFLCYYLSDILWAYSLTFVLSLLIGYSKTALIITGATAFLFEIGVELLQKFEIIKGTFDIYDFLTESIATISALIFISLYFQQRKDHIS